MLATILHVCEGLHAAELALHELQHQYGSATHSVPTSSAAGKGIPREVSVPPYQMTSTSCTSQNGSSAAAMQGNGYEQEAAGFPVWHGRNHQASCAQERPWEHVVVSRLFWGRHLASIEAAHGPASIL